VQETITTLKNLVKRGEREDMWLGYVLETAMRIGHEPNVDDVRRIKIVDYLASTKRKVRNDFSPCG
jgi:hypothetical protein